MLNDLLTDFMSSFSLSACDLSFHNTVGFTYERDDGLVQSWIDHILCSSSSLSLVSNVYTLHSGCELSDHFPLCHTLCLALPHTPHTSPYFYLSLW